MADLQRHGDGGRAEVMTLLEESLAMSELGMRLLMERVLSRRQILQE